MSDATVAARARTHWPELDALRGLAGVLMVLNHAGVRWLDENAQGFDAALTFAGGLAPVFFFLVTGTGRGLHPGRTGSLPSADVWRKVGLLVLADVAIWLSADRWLGMDFLGFIALSTLVVEFVKGRAHPERVAWGLIAFVLAVRFALAPALALGEPTPDSSRWLRFLLGDRGMIGFSYPPCPWLAYPLLGFLLGRWATRHADLVRTRRLIVAGLFAAAGALGLGFCAWLDQRGMIFFRWGNLSAAYTVFGVAASLCGVAFVLLLASSARASALFSLPGTSSLVVVPVHYLLIHLVHAAVGSLAPGEGFVALVIATTAVSLAGARAIDRGLSALAGRMRGSRSAWLGLALIAVALTLATGFLPGGFAPPRLVAMVLAQLAVCALFPLPWPTPAGASRG